ncbi:MAG: extracellular solute-binding protein [Dehalococcoidia bacterium]
MTIQTTGSRRYLGRRGFLRAAGLGAVGLAGAALIGCSSSDDEETATATATEGGEGSMTATATEAPGTPAAALGTADVLGVWGDEELANFEAMVTPWEDETGGTMEFTGTRDLTAILTSRVEGDNPPNIAIPAEVGLFRQFATEGRLVSLADLGMADMVQSTYPQGFVDLGTVDGTPYAFFMKADTKGTIWYNPKVFADNGWEPLTADSTWDDLMQLSTTIRDSGVMAPWSVGIESGGASGWPGSDWIQQILLNVHGPDTYDGIIDGSLTATDDAMKDSWQKFGEIVLTDGFTVQGGATGVNATGFEPATFPPFEAEPTAAMTYLGGFAAGFIETQFPDLVAGEDYDFMPFPGGGVTGGANIVYAFDSEDTTKSLMEYLASGSAQQIWVDAGGFTSVSSDVSLDSYPNPVAKKLAEQLANAQVFRFDLDDAVGGDWQSAYFTGITEYLANPDQLDSILEGIAQLRAT